MLDNLLTLIKQHAGAAIIDNPAIPNAQNDNAINMAGHSIMDGLKNMLAGGNSAEVVNLFNHDGNVAGTPAAKTISGGFVQQLMDKLGLGEGAASGIAASLIPTVLQKLVHKTNDPSDSSFNLQGILGSLTSGTGAGGLDVQQLLSQFQKGGGNAGGGIMDTFKGLMGK